MSYRPILARSKRFPTENPWVGMRGPHALWRQFCAIIAFCFLSIRIGFPADGSISLPSVEDLPVRTALPDPLLTAEGKKITTSEQWKLRREQMKQIIAHYAIGHAPPPPANVTGTELDTRALMKGDVSLRLVHLSFGPDAKLGLDAAVLIPAGTNAPKGPIPTFVQPIFFPIPGTPSATNEPPRTVSTNAPPTTNAPTRPTPRPPTLEELARQYEPALHRGYAVMIFYYQQCGSDNRDFRKTGFFPAYPGYDWGDLAAWAWAMSRCVDYLESQSFADKSRFIALGHSRLGKTALVAGAFDERFALVAPAGSGCGGTGAYRFNGKDHGGKEGLDDVIRRFPQWFGPELLEFSGQTDKLPFDQHWLIALVAPRCFIAADGLDDNATNGKALEKAWIAAKPIYSLLGVPDNLGINYRPGKHMLAAEDWQAILDFADLHLRGLDVKCRFDQIPPEDQLH
jgi:hypothetical protein